MKKIVFASFMTCLFFCTSCSEHEDEFVCSGNYERDALSESTFPVVIDENTSCKKVVVDGVTYTINIRNESKQSRGIDYSERVYDRDPKATLASVPVKVSEGKYKKYYNKASTPFAELAGVRFVMLRFDKYSFECVGPSNAKQLSFDITNITKQGFATESTSYRGFSIDNIVSSTSAVVVRCSFYIQNGAAYTVSGQQMTPDRDFPHCGKDVRYQFTYETK